MIKFTFVTKEQAEMILEYMNDILESFGVVFFGDLNELVGLSTTHEDYKTGWVSLTEAKIKEVKEGYDLELPPAEPISL